MKRNILFVLISVIIIGLLSACGGGKSVDLVDYVDLSFEGKDTDGRASYDFDFENAVADAYKFKDSFEIEMIRLEEKKPEVAKEIENAYETVSVSLNQDEALSNGDEVVVTVDIDEEFSKNFKGGEQKFTVEGLEEPEELTAAELEKHIIVDFLGASGQGEARIENTFNDELSSLTFTVEGNGTLKNGDEAKLAVNEENGKLIDYGYKLADDAALTYEVKGLDEIAEKASDIKNLKDVKRFIKEEINKKYPAGDEWKYMTRYKVTEEVSLYRQFEEADEDDYYYDPTNHKHGSYITLYSVERYNDEESEKKKDPSMEYIAMFGYEGMVLDDEGKVNISKTSTTSEEHDESYSLETVQQIYEGNGYEVVK